MPSVLLFAPLVVPLPVSADAPAAQTEQWADGQSEAPSGMIIASCTGFAPFAKECSTGSSHWSDQVGMGIRLSCPTCPFVGIVSSRIEHPQGAWVMSCQITSGGVAALFDCDLTGTLPRAGQPIRHVCVTSDDAVGTWQCLFARLVDERSDLHGGSPEPPLPG